MELITMNNQYENEIGYLLDTIYSTITVNTGDKHTRLSFAVKSIPDVLMPISSYGLVLHDVNNIENLTNLAVMIDKLVTPLLLGVAVKNIQNKRSENLKND
jgi:uncharacterized protein YebE (UPF0316 family)